MRPGRFHPGNAVLPGQANPVALTASMRPGRFHPGNFALWCNRFERIGQLQ